MPGRPRTRGRAVDAILERCFSVANDLHARAPPAALAEDLDTERTEPTTRAWAASLEASDELAERMLDRAGVQALRLPDVCRRLGFPMLGRILPGPPAGRAAGFRHMTGYAEALLSEVVDEAVIRRRFSRLSLR